MKSSFNELDEQIARVQRSTKTTLPLSARPHNWLRMHSPWYYKWHLLPFANALHILILAFYVAGITVGVLTVRTPTTYAAAISWDGGGSTNNWSEAANWSGDVVPGSGDAVTFSSTSTKDAVVDSSFTGVIGSLSITSGYTGTISLSRSLQTTGLYSQAGGIFTANNQVLDVDTNLTLTAGVFNASSNMISIGGNLSISGSPTFNHNSGIVNFDTGTAALTCNSVVFNLVTITNATGTKTVNSGCSLPLGSNPSSPASVILNGTLSGSGTLTFTANTLAMNSGSALSGFSDLSLNFLTVAGATLDLSTYNSVDINGSLNITGGSVKAPSGVMTVGTHFIVNGGTFDANGGTVEFDSSTTAAVTCTTSVTFNLVRYNSSGGTKTINSGCTIPVGNNPTLGSTALVVAGTISGTGTLTTTGTLTLNTGASLSGFSGLAPTGLTMGGATLDLGSYNPVDINGALAITTGTFTAPSGTMTVSGAMSIGSATFNHNNGTITFDGSTAATIDLACNNKTFNLITFAHTAGSRRVASTCNMPLGNDPVIPVGAALTTNGTLSGTGTLTDNANFVISNNGILSGFTGLVMNSPGGLTIASAVTIDFSAYTTVDINGAFAFSAGTVTAPPGVMRFGSTTTLSGTANFVHNNGTVEFLGAGTISCNNQTFNLVRLANTGTRTVSANCNLPLGNNPTAGSITNNGTLSGTGTVAFTASYAHNSSTSTLSGFSGITVASSLNILNSANLDLGSYTTVDLVSLLLSSGTFTAPSGTMRVSSNLTINGGTFNHNNGTIVIYTVGSATGTIACNNATFNLVVFQHQIGKTVNSDCNLPLGNNPAIPATVTIKGVLSGTGTLTVDGRQILQAGGTFTGFSKIISSDRLEIAGGDLDLSGYSSAELNQLLITAGTFTAPSTTMTIGNRISLTGGTFNHNNGTVVFTDNQSSQIIIGSVTFYNLSKVVTASNALSLPSNQTQTVLGKLTLQGTPTTRLSIFSSTAGQAATIDPRGTREISNIILRDVANGNDTKINVANANSIASGIFTGWNFNAPVLGSAGPSGVTNGSSLTTANPDFSFSMIDRENDTVKYQIQIDDTSDFSSPVVDYISGLAAAGSRAFKVGQAVGDGQYVVGAVGQGLGAGNYYWRARGIDSLGGTSDYITINGGKVAFVVTSQVATPTATPSPSPAVTVSPSPTSTSSPSASPTTVESSAIATTTPTPESTLSTSSAKKVMLQIRVVDEKQQPIKGALVSISSESAQAVTNEYGIATFPAVSPGTHKLVVAYNDQAGTRVINLNATTSDKPQSVAVTVQLKPVKLIFGIPATTVYSIILFAVVLIVFFFVSHRKHVGRLFSLVQ